VLSQYVLARCYQIGLGVDKNDSMAAKYFERAAEQGHNISQAIISEYYKEGIGVEKNDTLADYWLQKSMSNQ
jgi:TPR repeat protein